MGSGIQLSLGLALLALSSAADSACVAGSPSVSQEFEKSHGVIIGRVLAVRTVPELKDYLEGNEYSIGVEEVLRGSIPKTLELFSEDSSGRFPMKVGDTYLLFVYKALGRTVVDNCGNSGLLTERRNALDVVRKFQRSR